MDECKKAGFIFIIIGAIVDIVSGIITISTIKGIWWSWLLVFSLLIIVILLATFTFIYYESHPILWSILDLIFVSLVGGILLLIAAIKDPSVTNAKYYKLKNIKKVDHVDQVTNFDPKEYASFQLKYGYISKEAYDIVNIELAKSDSKIINTSDLEHYQKSLSKVELSVKLEKGLLSKENYDIEVAKLD